MKTVDLAVAEADLPDLDAFVTEASDLSARVINETSFKDEDDLAFMILSYLCKLSEQALSIQILIQFDHGRDAELVARSMLETMASLLWAAQDPGDRAFQWRGFAYVEDFRLMQKQKSKGIPVNKETEKRITGFLRTHATIFEDPRRAGKQDPYWSNWKGGKKINEIFTAVDGETLYKELYVPFSDWIHAGVKSLAEAISRTGKTIQWKPSSAYIKAAALSVAFQSLAEAMKLAASCFDSKLGKDVDSAVQRFKERFEPASR